jgi:hypothetical protein
VTSLVNWLAMRSVEQEAKRLEAAEQDAKRIRAQEEEAKRRAQEAARRAAEAAMPTSTVAPAFDKAPDRPPPIEIKPSGGGTAPRPRRTLPSVDRAATAPRPPAPLVIAPSDLR